MQTSPSGWGRCRLAPGWFTGHWKDNLRAGGFKFEARIINYPGGMPGDVGLFFAWPKDSLEG